MTRHDDEQPDSVPIMERYVQVIPRAADGRHDGAARTLAVNVARLSLSDTARKVARFHTGWKRPILYSRHWFVRWNGDGRDELDVTLRCFARSSRPGKEWTRRAPGSRFDPLGVFGEAQP